MITDRAPSSTLVTLIHQLQGHVAAAEAAIAALVAGGTVPTGPAGGDLTGTYPNPTIGTGKVTSSDIADGAIVNADVNSGAAIAYGKLALTNSILNGDINSAAAIAYSKLALSGSIVNADVNASAAIAYGKLNLSASVVNADIASAAAIAYAKLNLAAAIVNADVSASAAIAYSKLNLTGAILNADLAGSIANTKLATNPLARANHTGTQTASTVSDFDTQVRTSRLDQMAAPTADVSMNTHKLTNVTDPAAAQDATTLAYVQGKVFPTRGLVDYATAAALASYTGGGTSTLTASANGALSVDGGSPSSGQRILVKDEGVGGVAHLQNGIYSVTNAGSAGTKWVLTRATDLDAADEFAGGVVVRVQRGSVNGDSTWAMKTDPPITVNTTGISFRRDGNVDAPIKTVRVVSVAQMTISNPGTSTVDGVTLAAGDRVLLVAQSGFQDNGIYIFNGSSSTMTRAPDFDSSSEIVPGTQIFVLAGGYTNTLWWLYTTTTVPVVVGTTPLQFYSQLDVQNLNIRSGASFNSVEVRDVGTPLLSDSAATKNYVDTKNAIIDAKGDLIVGSADNTLAKLTVGTEGFAPISEAAATNGVAYREVTPWTIDISPYMTPATQTSFNTLTIDAACYYNGRRDSSAIQNAEVGWDVTLGAGTWTIELMYILDAAAGIYTVSLDGASQGTIDGYNAATTRNTLSSLTGLSVATTGKKRLLLKMATKNASSSNYRGFLQWVRLKRTA